MFQFLIDEDQDQIASVESSGPELSLRDDKTQQNEFQIGDRIRSDKDCGVIKYIGPVSPHTGIWLGVEWDQASGRGNHSGSVDGIEYFQSTRNNAASFVRSHKANKCKDVFSALQDRYGHEENMMKLKLMDENITPRIVRYEELEILDLAHQNIYDLGPPGELVKLCPKVKFLNLAENLLTTWETLAEVCDSFQHLTGIDVSGNPLLPHQIAASIERGRFRFIHLQHIVLGQLKYTWEDVLMASRLWPQVSNLQVPFNLISKLMPPTVSLLHLTSLDLESNQISSWEDVIKLNVCHKLEYLNLCGNRIKSVRFPINPEDPKNCQATRYFINLKRLNISQNSIEDWISIAELNKLQSLNELRIELNSVFGKDSKETNRQMVIARMGNLTKLEGVEITRQERRDAEIDYTKKFGEKWRLEGTELRFAVEHPRYVELIKRFGESDEGEVSKAPKSFQSTLITLEFVPEDKKVKPCLRKVMPNMTVQKLKMLLQRIFKLSTAITYLEVISSQNSGITFPLENDLFDLSQYSVEDGDKVVVRWRA